MMNSEKVKSSHYTYKDKDIIFAPLVHFGQKKFYENLKDSITVWKKKNYIVFYEEIDMANLDKMNIDSTELEILNLKFRRISNGLPTREQYAKTMSNVVSDGVSQPEYEDLGIDSTDINQDVSVKDIITKTEQLYGTIELSDCDYKTPLDSIYNCSTKWTNSMMKSIMINYRNKNVADKIIKINQKKIVILYGAMHTNGIKKILKKSL